MKQAFLFRIAAQVGQVDFVLEQVCVGMCASLLPHLSELWPAKSGPPDQLSAVSHCTVERFRVGFTCPSPPLRPPSGCRCPSALVQWTMGQGVDRHRRAQILWGLIARPGLRSRHCNRPLRHYCPRRWAAPSFPCSIPDPPLVSSFVPLLPSRRYGRCH